MSPLPLPAVITSLARPLALSALTTIAARPVLDRLTRKSSVNYPGHVPLNSLENAFLAVGSGVVGVSDTRRGDLVALLSETSSQTFIPALHASLKSTSEGRQILHDRPLINSSTIDLPALRRLRRGTLGREWVEWLAAGQVTPDTRETVHHVDSPVLAYTMTRYRQTHDLYHTLFSLPPTLTYELALKYLELANMSQPVAALSSLFGPIRLSSQRRKQFMQDWAPWALRQGARARPLVGVYWEKRWEQGLGDLRRELGVTRLNDYAVEARWKAYGRVREHERELRRRGEWVDEPEDW
ncbi:Ubiquinone biosynthesis protein [Naganishia albida]|nr:Ubiquinone biosynthesis protein [Naganishia albida]